MIKDMFNRLTGQVSVSHDANGTVRISGVAGQLIAEDIRRYLKTNVVSQNMFTSVTNNSVSFPSFFALEMEYLLRTMIAGKDQKGRGKYVYSSKSTLQLCLNELRAKTWLNNIENGEDVPLNTAKLKNIVYPLKDHQKRFLAWYAYAKDRYDLKGMLLTAAPGGGKAQPLYSKIKVPGGWATMGEMQEGTEVITPSGEVTRVTGVYPQGEREVYEITFKDGRKTHACGEHLWRYRQEVGNVCADGWITTDTRSILNTQIGHPNRKGYVPLVRSHVGNDAELSIDPYLLGVLLADTKMHWSVVLGTDDPEIIDNVRRAFPPGDESMTDWGYINYYLPGSMDDAGVKEIVMNANVFGKFATDKGIPTKYLEASFESRLKLIQGILDTGATINGNGIYYITPGYDLAQGLQYLVRSIGGISTLEKHEDGYYVSVISNEQVVTSGRRRTELVESGYVMPSCHDLEITSIALVGTEPVQCISVEHWEHLYVTDDFIVTHNTISGISVAETTECDATIVIAPNNAVDNVWAKTLEELMTVKTPYWVSKHRDKVPVPKGCKYFIYHYEDLPVALAMVTRGMIKGKICVILDESHNFNDPTSQRTQRFEMLCKATGSTNIVYSSGTPIKAMGADTVPLLRVLDPLFTPDVEARFKKIYGKNAAKANELLSNRLGIISYKVPKSEFMPDKPIEHPMPVKIKNGEHFTLAAIKERMVKFINERMAFYKKNAKQYEKDYHECIKIARPSFTPDQKKEFGEYERIVARFRKQGFDSYSDGPDAKRCNIFEKEAIMANLASPDRKRFKEAKSVYKYVDLKIRGECLGLVLGRERIAANVELAKALNYREIIDSAQKKVIFFSSHTEVVSEAVRQTHKLGYHPLMVTAETNKDLKQIVSRFDSDPKANPLVATYQSLSTAVPLTMANVVVAMNSPFRAHEMEQAIARAYRLGQDAVVEVYFCSIDTGDQPNISTRSADIMEWSKAQVDQIMGFESREDITLDDVASLEGYVNQDINISSVHSDDAHEYQNQIQAFHGHDYSTDGLTQEDPLDDDEVAVAMETIVRTANIEGFA